MPIEHSFDAATCTLRVRVFEPFVRPRDAAAIARLASDASLPSPRRELWDLREVHLDVPADELQTLAENLSEHDATHHSRVAVCTDSDLVFGLMRMYAAYRGDAVDIRVFRELADAETWLAHVGVPGA